MCDYNGPNCIKFAKDSMGLENVTKTIIIEGQSVSVRLYNWTSKVENTISYVCFSYEIINGVLQCGVVKYNRQLYQISVEQSTYCRPVDNLPNNINYSKYFDSITFCLDINRCEPFSIILQPNTQQVCKDNKAVFTVTTSGTGPFTYEWLIDDLIIDNNSNTFIPTDYYDMQEGAYNIQVNVTDSCSGDTLADNSYLTIVNNNVPEPLITGQVQDSICADHMAQFCGPDGNYSYKWETSAEISGNDNEQCVFIVFRTGTGDSATIKLTVTDLTTGCSNSSEKTINIIPSNPVQVLVEPQSLTQPASEPATFTANATGGTQPYWYVWFLNNSYFSQGTSNQVTLSGLSPGKYYVQVSVLASGDCETQGSNYGILTLQ